MMLTIQQLSKILSTNPNPSIWLNEINLSLLTWRINTPIRIAAFLSQCAHESVDFIHVQENLNYGPHGLMTTFPTHFTTETVDAYAHHPEAIGNCVYANRMGNGDEASGDGYKYRGRGILQITGKMNYHTYSDSIYGDDRIVNNPDLLMQPHDAILSACWYWNSRNLNSFADIGDITSITKKINGGLIGIDDRTLRYNIALSVLQ